MKSGWLITWEWFGDHAAVKEKVVSIINYRKSADFVKNYMDQLYIDLSSGVAFKYEVAKNNNFNPYPAHYLTLQGGVEYCGRIFCGHNPHLYGRKVTNIRVIDMDTDSESLAWDEIDIPDTVREEAETRQRML